MNQAAIPLSHRETLTRYYGLHASIYDATRWSFLYGRQQIVRDLKIAPGETVVELGCGTGSNFGLIQKSLAGSGKLIGVDCSTPMLAKCRKRIERHHWSNVELIDCEYGTGPVSGGQADIVLMSYSLSMMPHGKSVLRSARSELKPGGRIGIVDFVITKNALPAKLFAKWLSLNHVSTSPTYLQDLGDLFEPCLCLSHSVHFGTWGYYRFVGRR